MTKQTEKVSWMSEVKTEWSA